MKTLHVLTSLCKEGLTRLAYFYLFSQHEDLKGTFNFFSNENMKKNEENIFCVLFCRPPKNISICFDDVKITMERIFSPGHVALFLFME